MEEEILMESLMSAESVSALYQKQRIQSTSTEFDFTSSLQSSLQRKSQKKRKIKHKSLKSNMSTDDILNDICYRSSLKHPFSSDDIAVKSMSLPYMDAYFKISEFSRVEDELDMIRRVTPPRPGSHFKSQDQNSSSNSRVGTANSDLKSTLFEQGDSQLNIIKKKHNVSADYLRKRYSRLFSCFKLLDFDISTVSCRTDLWMVHFIEECYDDAMVACNKSIGRDKKPKGNLDRLDLGERTVLNLLESA